MAHQTSKNDDSHWNAFLSGNPSNRQFTKNENENHELNDNSGAVKRHTNLKADDGDLISQSGALHKALKDGQQDSEPDVEAVLGSMAAADNDRIISDFEDNAAVEGDEFVAPAFPDDGLIRALKRRRLSQVSDSNASSTSACGLVVPTSSPASPIISEDETSPPNRRELLSLKQHRFIVTMLKCSLETATPSLPPSTLEECLEMVEVLEEKYIKARQSVKRTARKRGTYPESAGDHRARLEGDEEKKHHWAPTKADRSGISEIPGLLMRAWDEISQCQIKDFRVGFRSGSSTDHLDTAARRKLALKRHSDWGNRHKTPFISFSISLVEIGETRVPWFQNRQKRAGILENTKLTIINARARLAAGKPIIRMKTELLHYEVMSKGGNLRCEDSCFYENEFLAPFSVSPAEIVGTWAWHSVEKWIEDNEASF
ncbi:uncharacterized protein RSE6_11872 [Rhynchosporium secalis]|uniref:DUF7587 domain-containing protein n=1 Tax=Rhynchosporium secalis TaxID=38038 RepID=A0A1E1MP18_RHYSE|nr:uncharacterized protein RSE6_11872 [Rhynchosporium secalis]